MRLVALLAAALALAAPATASEQHPTLAELESQLMCPVCEGETLAQSDSAPALQIKAHIQRRISEGATRSQIKDELVRTWGKRILAAPTREGFDLLAWVLPIAGVLAGAAALGFLAWRWSRVREPEPEPQRWSQNGHPLAPEEERRLDEELARFDG